jgi:hypothetical protein
MRPFPNDFVWFPERGYGFFPVEANPYDADYWENYRRQDRTDIGDALNSARLSLVHRHLPANRTLCDIGIGGGRFVEDCAAMLGGGLVAGFDVNPNGIAWLESKRMFADPYQAQFDALTFWDSLEHIIDPSEVLSAASDYVFVSLPIFTGPDHVLKSKHFKKDEHAWYFTEDGFLKFMREHGFKELEINTMEQDAGREDITTFAFKRVK